MPVTSPPNEGERPAVHSKQIVTPAGERRVHGWCVEDEAFNQALKHTTKYGESLHGDFNNTIEQSEARRAMRKADLNTGAAINEEDDAETRAAQEAELKAETEGTAAGTTDVATAAVEVAALEANAQKDKEQPATVAGFVPGAAAFFALLLAACTYRQHQIKMRPVVFTRVSDEHLDFEMVAAKPVLGATESSEATKGQPREVSVVVQALGRGRSVSTASMIARGVPLVFVLLLKHCKTLLPRACCRKRRAAHARNSKTSLRTPVKHWLCGAIMCAAVDVASAWYYDTPGLTMKASGTPGVIGTAFAPDGKTFAASTTDGNTVNFFHVSDGKEAKSKAESYMPLNIGVSNAILAYSPDGSKLASFGKSAAGIRLWNTADYTHLHDFKGLNVNVRPRNLKYSPNGETIASCSEDARLEIWGVETHALIRSVDLRPCEFYPNKARPNGRGCFWMGNLTTQDKENKYVGTIGHPGCYIAYTSDGQQIATSVGEQNFKVWDIKTGALLNTVEHTSTHPSCKSNPDAPCPPHISQNHMCSSVPCQLLRLDFGGSRDESDKLPVPGNGGVAALDYSPDGKYMMSGSNSDGSIYLWGLTKTTASKTAYTLLKLNTLNFDTPDNGCFGHRHCDVSILLFAPDSMHGVSFFGTTRKWTKPMDSGRKFRTQMWNVIGSSKSEHLQLARTFYDELSPAYSPTGNHIGTSSVQGVHAAVKIFRVAPCLRSQSFRQGRCHTFVVAAGKERVARDLLSGRKYRDPSEFFGIDEPYIIAPLEWSKDDSETSDGTGTTDEVEYSVRSESDDASLPQGLFVKTLNGDIQVQFSKSDLNKNYSVVVELVDTAKAHAILETMVLRVRPRDREHPDRDTFGPGNQKCANNGRVHDPNDQFDRAYTCDCSKTMFTGPNCGEAVTCEQSHAYVDGKCAEFKLAVGTDRSCKGHAAGCEGYTDPSPAVTPFFAVGKTAYRIPTVQADFANSMPSTGKVEDIVYTVSGVLPHNLFLKENGDILVQFGDQDADATYNVSVEAVDAGGARIVLERLVFRAKYRDTEHTDAATLASYGPGQKQCQHGTPTETQEPVNAFDGQYTCSCFSNYYGDNCENHREVKCSATQHHNLSSNECVTFLLETFSDRTSLNNTADGYTDPTTFTNAYFAVNTNYRIAALPIDKERTKPSRGPIGALRYEADAKNENGHAPKDLFVNAETGDILINFGADDAGTTFTLNTTLVDGGNARQPLEQVSMRVRFRDTEHTNAATLASFGPGGQGCANGGRMEEPEPVDHFDESYTCNCINTGGFTGANCADSKRFVLNVGKTELNERDGAGQSGGLNLTDPFQMATDETAGQAAGGNVNFYTFGVAYRIAPLQILNTTQYSQGNRSDIRFELTTVVGAKSAFYIRPESGLMQGIITAKAADHRNITYRHVVTLWAVDGGGLRQEVENITLLVRHPDTDVPEYGPHGRPCDNNATRVDDNDKLYDQAYTCKCAAGSSDQPDQDYYKGDNCEIRDTTRTNAAAADAKAAAKADALLTAAVAVAATILCLVALGYGGKRYYAYWLSIQPVDFQKEFDRMVACGDIVLEETDGPKIPREIRRRDLAFLETVGKGAFGEVWRCMLDEMATRGTPGYLVAAKTVLDPVKTPEGATELVAEATVMMQVVGHPNLVSIIGVVTAGDPLVLVLQLCEHGSVLSYSKKKFAAGEAVSFGDKMTMASEIAGGMAHLVDMHFIHRDLAARNVLLAGGRSKTGIVCKVADFGLSRGANNETDENEDYYKSSSGVFPVRWTSPEAMETLKFSPASDVWSFGVVVVEMLQDGETPYQGMSNPEVMKLTMSGDRHPQPKSCTDPLYAVLLECWNADVTLRPSFSKLKKAFVLFAAPEVSSRVIVADMKKTVASTEFEDAGNEYSSFGFDDDQLSGGQGH